MRLWIAHFETGKIIAPQWTIKDTARANRLSIHD